MGTTGQSITLANSIIGVGVLAMPFCYQQCGVLLATLILLLMGLVSRLCCYFLLKSALIARRRNFEFLAFHVFGPAGKLAVEVGIIGFLMGTCIAYFVVVGDLGPQIISKLFNINQSDILRTCIMVVVSLVCVLPLGLLRNVDSLSNVSAATIGFYFCLVMKVTSEAASQLVAGEWQSRVAMWRPAGVLQCVPIFSMALFCQTQLFEIFESLPSLSLEKMNVVTKNAINICTAVYFTLGLFGYIAFSSQTISGNILMSLSPTMASDVIKLGFVMSVAFSFPLIIFPCRASLYSFLYKKVHASHHDHIINHSIPESAFRCITVCIVAVSLCVSLLIPNIELVLGLVGSTIGVLVCVVFPAACFVRVTFKDTNERLLAKLTIALGLVILVLGTCANLQAAELQPPDRYGDGHITQERIDKIVEEFFEAKKVHKIDDVIQKPQPVVNGDAPQEKAVEVNKNGGVDSEVQPPNPVPPESQSNEKPQKPMHKEVQEATKKLQKEAEDLLKIDKLDSHPKNLKAKGSFEVKEPVEQVKEEKVEVENVKTEEKAQEKIDMMKQEKLIETIKQHGEEQKELLEEQKEILHEIKKTKEELKQNKENDINSAEAKKIAVESIKKIANMAIQSLSGVTDKPIDESPAKIANKAVQEIAKKAVESIVAIEDKLKVEKLSQDANSNKVPSISVVNNDQQPAIQNNNNHEKMQKVPVVPAEVPHKEVNKVLADKSRNVPSKNVPVQTNVDPNNVTYIVKGNAAVNNAINNPNPAQIVPEHDIIPKTQQNPNNQKLEIPVEKEHSHSPDEPQSYKRGEDLQQQKNEPIHQGIDQNVPLAVAMNANSQKAAKLNADNENVKLALPVANKALNDEFINPVQNVQNPAQIRHKREVADSKDENELNPKDKKNLLDPAKLEANTESILAKVDLNDALGKRLPIDASGIHIRSLKSIDETER